MNGVDLGAVARQPQPQGIPVPLGVPVGVDVQPIQTPQGGAVVMTLQNVHGMFIFALEPRAAIEVGKRLLGAGRGAATGLTLVGDVGSADDE